MYLNVVMQNSHVIVQEMKTKINENVKTFTKFAKNAKIHDFVLVFFSFCSRNEEMEFLPTFSNNTNIVVD